MDSGNTRNLEKLNVQVKFLDEHMEIFTVNMNSLGSELFQKVSIRTKLLENYFFGLSFESPDLNLCWLDLRKLIRRQFNANNEYAFDFCVKFYSPDPNMLHDSFTKQLFVQQLKLDLSRGELICCDSTRILLGAFFLQLHFPSSAEHDPVTLECFLKQIHGDQSTATILVKKSLDFYETLKDQTAEQTRFDLLETVRKIDFYGMKMHPAKDIEGVSLNLAVYHLGIVVFQKSTKINTFNWSRIRKLSFKRKRFLIKLHSEEYLELFILWVVQGFYKDTLEFYFDTRNSCKNFWKKCIEHHSFFRAHSSQSYSQSLLDRFHGLRRNFSGSRFRYVGPTQAELEHEQHQPLGRSNCVHRSESAGGLMPRDISLNRLARASCSSRYDSFNCLSYATEPSSTDFNEERISQQHSVSIPVSQKDNYNYPWNKIGVDNNDEKCPKRFLSDIVVNSRESKIVISKDGGLNSINDIESTLAKDGDLLPSLTVTRECKTDEENQSIFSVSLGNEEFSSFEFIPKLLAQALSSDECSYEFLNSGIDHNTQADESTNNGSSSRSFVSTSINSETSICGWILNSIIKEFLFNEFTHVKELQVLIEMIDGDASNSTTFLSVLDSLKSSTDTLISHLEARVQVNSHAQDNYQANINHFFLAINEYLGQTFEISKLYIQYVEDVIKCLTDQISSPPICLRSSQLLHLTKSLFHAKNPFRLLFSLIFQHRNRHKCIVTMYDFLLTREEDRQFCKDIITQLSSLLTTVDEIEEKSHKLLLRTSIGEIKDVSPRRVGWLQRLSSKGASNRLFVLSSRELICVKKIQSNAFIVEQSWDLQDIRVGSISDMINHSNGFNTGAYPFELITIVLCPINGLPNESSNVILIADSKRSQSMWINEINDSKSKYSQGPERSESKATKFELDWAQDYQLLELCWHDRISLTWDHAKFQFQTVLSSYILRKYTASSNWQRLWLVLSDCHLYFYRKHGDREALTTLCLVGFRTMPLSPEDSISKDWVLKLTKESKVYFLRTENQYFYLRWQSALQWCTTFVS